MGNAKVYDRNRPIQVCRNALHTHENVRNNGNYNTDRRDNNDTGKTDIGAIQNPLKYSNSAMRRVAAPASVQLS